MTLSTIAEEASSKDDVHAQAVNMDSPPPQILQPYQKTFDTPAMLGLVSLGTVFLCLSILTLASRSVIPPSIIVVIATFYGGISQIIVGVWEIFLGNNFSAMVFATYGAFSLSYGILCLPQTGLAGDGAVGQQFHNAIGIYLAIWSSITFLLLLGALRTATPFVTMHISIVCALTCLSLNAFTGNLHLAIAGGTLGTVASFSAYYSALSFFCTQRTSFSFSSSFIRFPLMMAPSNV